MAPWILSFHIITIVTWFAGIFYLPRLYVYHAMSDDPIGIERFKVMERKLYRGIMMPSGIIATLLGIWLVTLNYHYYLKAGWFHAKVTLVALLWIYHLYCGQLRKIFYRDENRRSHTFYRFFNEIPVVLLIAIVILVVVKPF